MAPLNAIPSGDASPSHSAGPAANHLAHATNDRRRRRTNARRTQRKFLVYPSDQLKMLNNGTERGAKDGKTNKNGTWGRTNHDREEDGIGKNGLMRTEADGAENSWTRETERNGISRIEFDRTEMNGLRTKLNGTEQNGTKSESDGMSLNGKRTEQNGREMNGRRSELEELMTNGTGKLGGQEKRHGNGTEEKQFWGMRTKTQWEDEEEQRNGISNAINGIDEMSTDGQSKARTEMKENGMGWGPHSVTDRLLTEKDAVESATGGQSSQLLLNGQQSQHFGHVAKLHSFWEEMPISSSSLLCMDEEQETEQKQQQHHRRPTTLSPRAVLAAHLPKTVPKSNDYEEESHAIKRQRCTLREQLVGVPSVAAPWEATAAERLGTRRSKVIMLGDSGVGKTSIVFSHKYGPNPALLNSPSNATIGASYTNFDMSVFNAIRVQLQIWDTAGQERFRCMVPLYMRNASAAVLVYDITNRESFEQIEQWHNEVLRCPTALEEPIFVLIGNKADQQDENREVAEGEGVQKALRLNAHFFEVSSVDSEVIRSIFKLVAEKIVLQSANVESAREADEAIFGGWPNERTAAPADGKSDGKSPVIRLGPEDFDWAAQLLISGRNWWRWAAGDGAPARTAAIVAGGNCCAAL
ncbi:hypothetical protein niasHT_010324 [Heterodera trifolii]|uniref:Uncharacterized protein n=1 Tax=Heterodera trifolii TaxID=157864 RepID=A0ABD2M602_9BILA